MPGYAKDYERFYAADRAEWRAWLAANHDVAKGVWLIYYKKQSGKPRVSYEESVEEALCFGWIDSVVNKIDEECYMQLFSPRKASSGWSRVNKERVERLLAAGLIETAGLQSIAIAKANGKWESLDEVEKLTIPDDLQTALEQYPPALENFMAFSRSVKRGILEWIHNAKRPETRMKRVLETAQLAAQNIKAQFTPKDKR
ncbi:MAG: YdeI/OmpD-associated family protein [Ignavibacteria bacterium]|nr:YdeI/OmpD-associated family protein [Ignavibacteria bacterium]